MNVLLLAGGTLLFALSAAHIVYGKSKVLNTLQDANLSKDVKTSFRVTWQQLAWALVIAGFILILTAISRIDALAAALVLALVLGNLVIFSAISMLERSYDLIRKSFPQYALFLILILLILLGLPR